MKILRLLLQYKKLTISVLIVAAAGYGVWDKYFSLDDAERAQKELAKAVEAVSKHMILPEGDEPVLATVTDAETLTKQQAFFAGSQNGDQLLLFPRNLKAIIYSPSREKIINVGPIEQSPAVTENDQAPNSKSQINSNVQNSNAENTLTVEVRNGTDRAGYAATIAEQIAGNAGYTVVSVADTRKKGYDKTIVVARTDDENKKPKVQAVANTFGVSSVTELPSGETDTTADVLIILGGK